MPDELVGMVENTKSEDDDKEADIIWCIPQGQG